MLRLPKFETLLFNIIGTILESGLDESMETEEFYSLWPQIGLPKSISTINVTYFIKACWMNIF